MTADAFALAPGDPPPVERVVAQADTPVVLTCEHAGQALPQRLAPRAPPPADMDRHIAWDIGAESVARGMAEALGAPLVVQRYSRLVIDCNRPRPAPDLAPPTSDGSAIAFNQILDPAEIDARWEAIHAPFHAEVAATLDRRAGRACLLAPIHSFAPSLGGAPRPWHVGLLARTDLALALAQSVAEALGRLAPDSPVALNQPYRIDDGSDYTIPVHGEGRGLPHVLVEIRHDLIAEPEGARRWAAILAECLLGPLSHSRP